MFWTLFSGSQTWLHYLLDSPRSSIQDHFQYMHVVSWCSHAHAHASTTLRRSFPKLFWGRRRVRPSVMHKLLAQLYDFMQFRKRHFTLLLLLSGPVRRDLPTLRGAFVLTREEGADPTLPDVIVADPGPPVLLCSRLLRLVFGPCL